MDDVFTVAPAQVDGMWAEVRLCVTATPARPDRRCLVQAEASHRAAPQGFPLVLWNDADLRALLAGLRTAQAARDRGVVEAPAPGLTDERTHLVTWLVGPLDQPPEVSLICAPTVGASAAHVLRLDLDGLRSLVAAAEAILRWVEPPEVSASRPEAPNPLRTAIEAIRVMSA